MDYNRAQQRPRSQTLFGNALGRETLFPRRGCLRVGARSRLQTPPPRETEFRPQLRSQTEFGNEALTKPGARNQSLAMTR